MYSDAVVFSKKLLGSLRTNNEDSYYLLSQEAIGFWTERSDRCGLDSWRTALGYDASQRDVLGRWGAQGSAGRSLRKSARVGGQPSKATPDHGAPLVAEPRQHDLRQPHHCVCVCERERERERESVPQNSCAAFRQATSPPSTPLKILHASTLE